MFILTPVLFIWTKSFLFYILRSEIDLKLSLTDLFIIDTTYSVFAFMLVVAVAIHSLTKTFRLKRDFDPKFDIFHLSEYFHLWWTHIVMSAGAMLVATFFSVMNVIVPFKIVLLNKPQFYVLLIFAMIMGGLLFLILWMTDAKQANFMRIMKLLLAFFLVVHIVIYFIADPAFNMSTGAYWFMFMMFFVAVLCGSWFEKHEKTNRLKNFLVHFNWGNNIDLFGNKKRN